jgi:hypothetical protein
MPSVRGVGLIVERALDQRGQLLRAAHSASPRSRGRRMTAPSGRFAAGWTRGPDRTHSGRMAHQGYDLQLTRYDERGWRATFYTTGMEHSPTSATGTGWERTP